ncbi:AAA family ATPase [Pyrobaculum aerophilum]|uniref:Magnesium chelatase n=1 Tax=Pyrobaculum aerophilum TaxID=13773 RepID=A0A371QXB4_9CREN|nr:MoxR family ATPase [Pyrobaculum aerophilum]RFA95044.1 magnesium chelatase [Pyrobaculum aerophilum]RFA97540.1 magnesium chelatase [Pyrobaculum aerophilum]
MRKVVDVLAGYYVAPRETLELLLSAIIARGHVLFNDPPGLGKTTLAKILAKALGLNFRRIQFTPDMLPSDVIGVNVWRPHEGRFEFIRGPVFTNILLADEINRAPPKTQAALLEAMEERQVTVDGVTYKLEEPFIVLATQNPVEFRGVYPLPEAELDRFLIQLSVGYPGPGEEAEILRRRISWRGDDPSIYVKPVTNREEIIQWMQYVEAVYVDEAIIQYIVRIAQALRTHPLNAYGPSPRGSIALMKISRALALLGGRNYVVPDDVKKAAVAALAHRIAPKEGDPRDLVREVLNKTPIPY